MGAVLIPIVLFLIVVWAVIAAVVQLAKRERDRADRLRADRVTLRYDVPVGLDPADVMLLLSQAGYSVAPDTTEGRSSELLIGGRSGGAPDREEVRQLLTQAAPPSPNGSDAPVRFIDE